MPKNKSGNPNFQPKYSVKLQDFIVDKIEEGRTLAEICRDYGPPQHDVVPNEKTMYRWKKKYPEFKKALDDAYQTLIFKMMDEMNDRSKEALELANKLKNCGDMDDAKLEAMKLRGQLDSVKMRLKALEFMLSRIAPKLVNDLRDVEKTSAAILPPITIKQYVMQPVGVPALEPEMPNGKTTIQ